MNKILAVTARLLRSNLKHPQRLLIMLVFPIFFTFVFGGVLAGQQGTTKYPVGLSCPGEAIAEELAVLLKANPRLAITLGTDEGVRRLVRERKVIAAVIIPPDFAARVKRGETVKYSLVREEENNIYLAVKQEVDQAFLQIHTAAVTARYVAGVDTDPRWQTVFNDTLKAWENQEVKLAVNPVLRNTEEVSQRTQANVGFSIMFLMMNLVTITGIMLQERVDGTWQRLLSSPIRRGQILAGYLLGYFILGWLQFAILLVASRFLFDIYWGNLWGLSAIISVFILCSISLALVIGGFVKTFQQQQATASILITATSMLGGVFWPLELEPKAMQLLARGIPQYWAMNGINNLLTGGLDWTALALPLGVLAGFTVVFFTVGTMRMRFE
ncbi:MAG TPA: ABC transporter permease [Verrucomicrobiae bacterium]|nr:ABC transporter permease [Verrucomicrobiae bacterium]